MSRLQSELQLQVLQKQSVSGQVSDELSTIGEDLYRFVDCGETML